MTLEVGIRTLFPYQVYEAPTSIPYEPTNVLLRIFDLNKTESLEPIAIDLYKRSIGTNNRHAQVPNIGIELWNDERALTNHFLGNEVGFSDTKPGRVLSQILRGDFNPLNTLKEINSLGLITETADPWEILRGLTSISNRV